MPSWVWSNVFVVCLLLMAGGVTYSVRRSRMWSEIFRDLWRRRRFALLVVAFYVLVALLDSVYWVGGMEESQDTVARYEAQSILDDRERLVVGSHGGRYRPVCCVVLRFRDTIAGGDSALRRLERLVGRTERLKRRHRRSVRHDA